MVPFAITLSDLIERGGAYAGLAAFFGLAVLAILYFAQAREVRRLREWAGRAPERAQELEERVVAQAETASRVVAKPIRRPGQPVTAAAKAAPAAEAAPEGDEEGSATEHPVVASADAPAEDQPTTVAASVDADASETDAEADAEAQTEAESEEREAVPAGVVASSAAAVPEIPVKPAAAPGTATPPPSAPGGPALPPRATQGPPARRPAPAAAPLRSTSAPTRRPAGAPPRRPAPPPLPRNGDEGGRRRTGILAAGALAGVTLVVVGLIAILGGGGDSDPQASAPEPTVTAPSQTTLPSDGGDGGNGNGNAQEPSGPTREETSVAVLNGTTVAGLAATVDTEVTQLGYVQALEPANWVDSVRSASVVFYDGSEYREQAFAIADALQIEDRQAIIEDASALAPGANVVIVVGSDQA